ncbi:siderophore-interacting protein [Ruania alba]|uniref:NADPH-dependent ferric siderophore reductase, contains FAD-binding and SIP domains n=1 Tax=Ruania alba TaxID=648782 RepID=A0A1H5KFK8_9MICO|nr:siderophore-interacting protein [Ruania alba]SEE62891.1 NADPH-dependent ferric siderophore reductase, contains FAD-binding and SIP domains [Ruania alba]
MPKKVAQRAEVVTAERITPHMVRIVLSAPGGGPLETDPAGYTDTYVKVVLPRPGTGVQEPFDIDEVKERLSGEDWPVNRTYTIRAWDPKSGHATIDFVVHGDEGIAGPWAARAQPGDLVQLLGPGRGYAPNPEAGWHLLVGDESALPAIAATVEAMPEGAQVRAFIEVADPSEEQALLTVAHAQVTWIHRSAADDGAEPGEALVQAVRGLRFPPGRVHAFVHGDAGVVKQLRALLRFEREVPKEDLHASGYWKRGTNDDQWRAVKRQWVAQMEAEEEARNS